MPPNKDDCDSTSALLVPRSQQSPSQDSDRPCPYMHANWLSRITMWWMASLIHTGFRRRLHTDDLTDVPPSEKSELVTSDLERKWRKEKQTADNTSLFVAILSLYRRQLILDAVMTILMESSKLVQPVLIGYILNYLQGTNGVTQGDAYGFAVLALVMTLCFSVPYSIDFHTIWALGMRGRAALSGMLFKKVMRLSVQSLQACSSGRIVNLLATDVETFTTLAREINFLWLSPLVTLVVVILLFLEFGWAFLAGCAAMCVLLVLEAGLGTLTGNIKMKVSGWTDKRCAVMNEILAGMQMIKTFCWEHSFAQLIENNRRQELKTLLKGRMVESQIKTTYFLSHKVIAYITILTSVYLQRDVSSVQAVMLIGWLEFARTMAFGLFPLAVISCTEAYMSFIRIQRFLEMPEQDETSTMPLQRTAFDILKLFKDGLKADENVDNSDLDTAALNTGKDSMQLLTKNTAADNTGEVEMMASVDDVTGTPRSTPQGCSVVLHNVAVEWASLDGTQDAAFGNTRNNRDVPVRQDGQKDGTFGMKGISMNIGKGELVVVVGSVGSGKSSLLMALLGEMSLTSGSVTTEGRVTYVPQEPWIISDSLRQNILMGNPPNEQHYNNVIDLCSLLQDLEAMPRGDRTLVGERGWKLSGGQKTRVNLARSVYADADIYLLDDPLSSVDATVGKQLFDRCICGILAKKTRILVTHQLHYLSVADRVIVVRQGSIVACGTFDEVRHTKAFEEVGSCKHEVYRSSRPTLECDLDAYVTATGFEDLFPSSDDGQTAKDDSGQGVGVWLKYIQSANGYIVVPIYCLLLCLALTAYVGCDWIFVRWCTVSLGTVHGNGTTEYDGILDFLVKDQSTFLWTWTVLLVVLILTTEAQSILFFTFCIFVSRNVQQQAFRRVMKAPMAFFENNPVGQILNRFSRDVGFMDLILPRSLHVMIGVVSVLVAQLVFVVVISPWLALATVPLVIIMFMLNQYSLQAIRDLRRLEATCRAPIYSILMDVVRGLPIIRAMHKQSHFSQQFNEAQDRHTSAWFLFFSAFRWLGVRAEWLLAVFNVICMLVAISAPGAIAGGTGAMGLGLTYLAFIIVNLQTVLRYSADVNTMITSVERLCEYHTLDQEADDVTDVTPPDDWPSQGEIVMKDVSLQYVARGPRVLHDVNIHIKPREKVGIVGRTGAGKSTLMKCLLRLVEAHGTITIDGVDIAEIGLKDLRSNLSVIPQDPIFLAWTLRRNLDPFEKYTDQEIWTALEQVHIKTTVADLRGSLSCEVLESGCNFSVGQKQLLCLARAILRRGAVLLVDEATANVDNTTDALVRKTIAEQFNNSTVLTIAHRIDTVMDSDRVLVLAEGRVVEFDNPNFLLQDPNSHFFQLVQQKDSALMPDLIETAISTS